MSATPAQTGDVRPFGSVPTSPPSPETAADRNVGSGRSASPAQRGHARKRKGPRPVKVRGRRVLESPTSHDFPGVGGVIRPESPDEQPRIPAPQHGRPRSPPGIGYREVRKEGPFAKPVFRAKLSAWQSPRIVPPGQEYNEIEIPKNSKRAEPGQRIGALNRESRVSPRAPLATARTAVTDIVLGSARRTLGMLSSRRRSDASEAITLAPLGARTLRTARTLNLSATAPAAPPRPGDLVSNSFTSLPGLIVPPGGPKLQTFGPAELAEKRRKAREAARRRRLLKQGIGKPTQADILSRRDPTPRDVEEGAADEGEQPPAGEAAVSARDTTAVAVRGSKSRKRRGARPTRERVLTGYLKLAYEAGLTQLAVSAGTTLDYLFLVATSPAKALPSVEAADEAEAADAVAAAAAQEASIEFAALMAVDKGKAAQLVDADENDGEGSVASLTDEQLAEKAAAEKAARDKALEKAREAAEAELEAKLESGKPKLKRATTVDLLTAEDVRGQFKRSKSRRRWPTEEEQKLEEKRRKVQAAGASERADAEARDAEDESDKPDDFTKLATRGAQPPSKAKIWRGPVFEGLIRAKATTRRIEVTRSIYAHGPPPTYYTKDEGLQIVLRRHHAAALKLQRLVRGNFARTRTTAIQTAVRAVADGGILYAAGHQLGKMVCVVTVRPDCLPAPAPPPATHNPQYVIAAVRVFAYDVTTQESTVMRVPAALVGTSADGTGYISGQDITAWFMDTRVEAYWQEPSPARIELTGNRSRFRLKVISRTASLKRIRENALDSMATPAQRATAKKQVYRGFHGLDGGLYGLCTLKRVVPADDVDPLTPLLLEMYAPAQQIALHIVFTHLDALLTEFQPVPFKSGFDAAKRLIDCRVVKRSILGVPKLIVRPPTEPMNRDLSRMLRRMRGRKLPNGQHQEGIYSSMHLINKRLTGVSIIGDTDPPRGKVLGEVTMLWIHVHDVAKNISGRISIQSDIALEGLGIHLHAKDRLIPAMFSYGLMARMIDRHIKPIISDVRVLVWMPIDGRRTEARMTRMQARVRGMIGRKRARETRKARSIRKRRVRAAIKLQCLARRYFVRRDVVPIERADFEQRKLGITGLQRVTRGRIGRNRAAEWFALSTEQTTLIQSVQRAHAERERYKKKRYAATRIANAERCRVARARLRALQFEALRQRSAARMQALYRGRKARMKVKQGRRGKYEIWTDAAIRVQKVARGMLSRKYVARLRAEIDAEISSVSSVSTVTSSDEESSTTEEETSSSDESDELPDL